MKFNNVKVNLNENVHIGYKIRLEYMQYQLSGINMSKFWCWKLWLQGPDALSQVVSERQLLAPV